MLSLAMDAFTLPLLQMNLMNENGLYSLLFRYLGSRNKKED
jgi:hypothetical protein